MKLKILITGTSPNYVARVIDQTFTGPDLLMEKGKKKKCETIVRAMQEVKQKLLATYKDIPLVLEWEIEAK